MLDKEERNNIIKAILKHDDHYKSNPEALMDLEESLVQAEVMLSGNLPMKTARELLQELREDM